MKFLKITNFRFRKKYEKKFIKTMLIRSSLPSSNPVTLPDAVCIVSGPDPKSEKSRKIVSNPEPKTGIFGIYRFLAQDRTRYKWHPGGLRGCY